MYSKVTIDRYLSAMKKWYNHYTEIVDDVHVSVSTGNDKIGHVLNVSTAAVFNCPNCAECKWYCYDVRDCIRHGYDSTTLQARAKNTAILRHDRDRFFKEIQEAIDANPEYEYFRFHVGGEMTDLDYFDRIVTIARNNPRLTVWTYTKMYRIVNRWIMDNGDLPENLHVMFSEWRGMPMENPHGMPEFRVVFKGEAPDPNLWTCPGNCDECKAARRGCVVGETTQAYEH